MNRKYIFQYFACLTSISSCSYLYHINNLKKKNINKYTYNDLKKYNNKDIGILVSYKDQVYNISDFIENHPGGQDKIMLAAGKAIDPYWNKFKQHTNDKSIYETILKPMKVGILTDYDVNKYKDAIDPYINDPVRDTDLKFHSYTPCNAESPSNYIMDNWLTPNELWYIRNHNPVPKINEKNYCLSIEGIGIKNNKCIKLDEFKKTCKKHNIISTIQCGGNRRGEYNKIEKTSGTSWKGGAISNADWGGILLKDFLIKYGIDINDKNINHVEFEGIDGVKASIPIEKALNQFGDVLLAYEMNGEILPRDHGYPIRIIVPGHVGIRNIKWLKTIRVREDEAEGAWQRGLSYKRLPPFIKNAKDADLTKIAAIQELPIQSLIIIGNDNILEKNDDNKYIIKGIAYSGGGRGIVRVELSLDNGKTWKLAELGEGYDQKINKAWAWTFWNYTLNDKEIKNKKLKLICRANDSSYNVQPKDIEDIWNIRGLSNNSWYKLEIKIK